MHASQAIVCRTLKSTSEDDKFTRCTHCFTTTHQPSSGDPHCFLTLLDILLCEVWGPAWQALCFGPTLRLFNSGVAQVFSVHSACSAAVWPACGRMDADVPPCGPVLTEAISGIAAAAAIAWASTTPASALPSGSNAASRPAAEASTPLPPVGDLHSSGLYSVRPSSQPLQQCWIRQNRLSCRIWTGAYLDDVSAGSAAAAGCGPSPAPMVSFVAGWLLDLPCMAAAVSGAAQLGVVKLPRLVLGVACTGPRSAAGFLVLPGYTPLLPVCKSSNQSKKPQLWQRTADAQHCLGAASQAARKGKAAGKPCSWLGALPLQPNLRFLAADVLSPQSAVMATCGCSAAGPLSSAFPSDCTSSPASCFIMHTCSMHQSRRTPPERHARRHHSDVVRLLPALRHLQRARWQAGCSRGGAGAAGQQRTGVAGPARLSDAQLAGSLGAASQGLRLQGPGEPGPGAAAQPRPASNQAGPAGQRAAPVSGVSYIPRTGRGATESNAVLQQCHAGDNSRKLEYLLGLDATGGSHCSRR